MNLLSRTTHSSYLQRLTLTTRRHRSVPSLSASAAALLASRPSNPPGRNAFPSARIKRLGPDIPSAQASASLRQTTIRPASGRVSVPETPPPSLRPAVPSQPPQRRTTTTTTIRLSFPAFPPQLQAQAQHGGVPPALWEARRVVRV